MSPDPEVVIFDPAGDVVLLVKVSDDQCSHEKVSHVESSPPVRGATIQDALADDTAGVNLTLGDGSTDDVLATDCP